MKIPRSIRIKGNKWLIKHKWNLRNSKGEELDGECDPVNKIIFIDRACTKEEKQAAFIHEMAHAYFVEYGLRAVITHDAEEMTVQMVEEMIVERFLNGKKKA